jgi:mannose-6-phosphate isomerase-like protein (cupin superfamily)
MVTKTPRFKPTRIFVHLEDGGAALPVECTPALWRETGSGTRRYDRLVGVLHFEEEADLHPTTWEMHPSADEFLFLVSGAVRLILQEETSERSIELGAGQATIVPRGVWHRLLNLGRSGRRRSTRAEGPALNEGDSTESDMMHREGPPHAISG